MDDFKGKTAVITGGASGIGLALAERFGREGCRLLLGDIDGGALDAAVAQLAQAGIEAHGHVTDVADHAAVQSLADRAAGLYGKVHLLFNNAGVSITGPTWELTHDDWRWVWGVNVWGVVNGIKAFLPRMMAHGEPGHVINTGSLTSFSGNGSHAPYCSSKAAVLGLSQSLYSEMKAMMTGIGVSILCPGIAATRIHQSWRSRPPTDAAWSDREFADEEFRAASASMHGQGIAPALIAESTFEAVRDDRFYVFTGEMWPDFLAGTIGRALRAENPFVTTWGEDRRPEEGRALPPWGDLSEVTR